MLENPLFHNALGSATSGIIARIITHPLDTAKARLQAPNPNPPYQGTIDVLRRTIQTEGASALYRGFGAVIVGGTPGTMIYLCGYDYIQDRLRSSSWLQQRSDDDDDDVGTNGRKKGETGPLIPFCAGMIAETLACVIYVPVDVVKERLQVQRVAATTTTTTTTTSGGGSRHSTDRRVMNGSWDALRTILRTEGWKGIYKGYGATLASFGPFSAFYFVFYERMKGWSREVAFGSSSDESSDDISGNGGGGGVGDKDLPFAYIVASSAGAGAAAAWLTSPLDMAKLRIQIQSSNCSGGGMTYSGMVDCLQQAHRAEGVRGLFRGSVARMIHFAPSMAITMTCYEMCRSFYARALCGD